MSYLNVLYVRILIWDHNNFARVTSEPKYYFRARFRQTSHKDLVFARGEFLSVVGAQNESLRFIMIYYFKLHIWDLNNFVRFTSEPKNPSKGCI